MGKTHLRLLALLILSLIFCSCMPTDKSADKQAHQQVYIDANLMFEISYPEEWARVQRPTNLTRLTKQTTTWRINNQQSKDLLLEFTVLSIPAELNPYGYSGLETILTEQKSGLIIKSKKETTLPVGPAITINGDTSRTSHVIWLYLGEQRHYIICCSTATAVFEQNQNQFIQIVDSFKTFK
jgi:hypothetical protein